MNIWLWGFVILSGLTALYTAYLIWVGMSIAEKDNDEGGHR